MKLALGTVQFGQNYGISNRGGQTPRPEVGKILSLAHRSGLRTIDTAAQYGTSEEALGEHLGLYPDFRLVTKTVAAPLTAERVREGFRTSLSRLGRPSVYGFLVHAADELIGPRGPELMRCLEEFKSRGEARKVGVSVYTADQIDSVLGRYPIDIIQAPFNVFDQRLLKSGHLRKIKDRGVELHTRSAFLQGLLLMDPASLPKRMERGRPHLESYREHLGRIGLTPLQGALRFALATQEIDAVVCGVESAEQLQELILAAEGAGAPDDMARFAFQDESIIDPRLWGR